MSDTSDKITKILEDPESIKMIAQIAEGLMGSVDKTVTSNEDNISVSEMAVIPDKQSISSEVSGFLSFLQNKISLEDIENTVILINALKPYLSQKRCEGCDTVVKLLQALRTVFSLDFSGLSSLVSLIK